MINSSTSNPYAFLTRGGQAGEFIRNFDWSSSSLGTPDQWPAGLRVTVSNLLQTNQPMLVLWGEDNHCFYNDAVLASLGPHKHPAIGQPARQLWAEDWDHLGPLIERVLKTGEPVIVRDTLVPVYRREQTEPVYWTCCYSLILDDEGQPGGVLVTCQDTTDTVRARQAFQRSQQLFDNLFSSAPVAIALFDGPQFIIEQANERVLEYWGRSRQQVMHKPLFEALPEAAGQGFEELLRKVYTTGERFIAKELSVTLDRNGRLEPTYIDFVYEPFRQADGLITGILVICTEITEQVLARQRIEVSEQLLRDMVLKAPIGIGVLNAADLVIDIVNPSFMEVAGKPYDQLMGKPYWIPFAEAAPYYEEALNQVVQQGEPFSANEVELCLIRHGQEETIYVTFVYMPIKDAAGRVKKVAVWVLENTHQVIERRKVEEQVAERTADLKAANEQLVTANALLARSNASLQEFAYVASHDLQEPLRKIQQFGNLLMIRYAATQGDERLYLERMQSAASRMSTLIRDLLDYSRVTIQRELSTSVSLSDVVGQVITTLEMVIAETGATIQVDALPMILGDASQLYQLFQNLLSNAVKFRQPSVPPFIRVSGESLSSQQLPLSLQPSQAASHYYRIDVTDNGIGFEEKYLSRIFQVFQRLYGKNEYAGTGIGLAICEKVAANHGGAITASSQPGRGATFSVYFPMMEVLKDS